MVFLSNVYTVFIQVLMLAILVAIGFLGDRLRFFTEKAARLSNDLLFYIITPAVIINSFLRVEFTKDSALSFLKAFCCMAAFHAVGVLVGMVFFNRCDKNDGVIYKYASVYGNVGYMGLPLSAAVMQTVSGSGETGVFYCSAAVCAFNIFSFTHGVMLMSKTGGGFDLKKLIINPGTIGILIGAPLFLLRLTPPEIISTPLTHLANMNTPLAMLCFGTYLSKADLKAMWKQGNIYFTALLKLIVLPLAAVGAFYLAGIRGDLLIVASVFVSAPTANNTVMFAAKFDRDTALASQVSGLVSVLSIITMPACVALAMLIA